NINRLLTADLDKARTDVRRLCTEGTEAPDAVPPLRLRLYPPGVPPSSSGTDQAARLGSFGQVFDRPAPQDLIGPAGHSGLADRLTCWGDGRLNFRRADRQAM